MLPIGSRLIGSKGYIIAYMNKITKIVGCNIRKYRNKKGWTQEQLARELGISLNTVQRWESGKNKPSPLALEKLQKILDNVLDGDQLRMPME